MVESCFNFLRKKGMLWKEVAFTHKIIILSVRNDLFIIYYIQQSDEIAKFSYRWYDIVACNGLWVQAIGKPVYKIGNVPKLFNLSLFYQ